MEVGGVVWWCTARHFQSKPVRFLGELGCNLELVVVLWLVIIGQRTKALLEVCVVHSVKNCFRILWHVLQQHANSYFCQRKKITTGI